LWDDLWGISLGSGLLVMLLVVLLGFFLVFNVLFKTKLVAFFKVSLLTLVVVHVGS